MGMRDFASTFHNDIVEAMKNLKGSVLKTGEILNILIRKFPHLEVRETWIQPPDHCVDVTNDGACYCAKTEKAIFEKISHGKYKVRESLHKL